MEGEKFDVGQLSRRKLASVTHVDVTEQTPARTTTPGTLAPTSTFYASPQSRSPQITTATPPTLPGPFNRPTVYLVRTTSQVRRSVQNHMRWWKQYCVRQHQSRKRCNDLISMSRSRICFLAQSSSSLLTLAMHLYTVRLKLPIRSVIGDTFSAPLQILTDDVQSSLPRYFKVCATMFGPQSLPPDYARLVSHEQTSMPRKSGRF